MDQLISASTGDYTGTRSQSLENPVYLRLKTPVGSYWADPLLGSRLHELAQEKDVNRIYMLARQYAEQALQTLLNDGRAKTITVTAQRIRSGFLLLLIDVVDAWGKKQTFKHSVRVV
ncbi:hypothetical protein EKN56_06045 [Limnobaculum zhutongyuii]|uniref:Phage protein GP46 n=1 Tax=Limnobaculum zhutongyuii TaxID=2498113 RepID=A0A411WII3_9GAMM|nr:phage GP46 family protein [Limnobaculum zhutongyuii]QBH95999.1 hypothetical protein EKN56_06045 [Limnobaculum zhutongyuii]TQS89290.1 hypothetical protein ELQ32_05875 [Limnobaculum zhutongyuii]